MDITLRPATKNDTEFARLAHHRAYRDVVVSQFGSWDESRQDKLFHDNWNQLGFEIILYNDVPCGYLRFENLENEIRGHELVILPEFQGKGIGSHLLKNILADGARRGVPVTLQVLKNNRAAELYRKLGFQEVERTDTHIKMQLNSDEGQ